MPFWKSRSTSSPRKDSSSSSSSTGAAVSASASSPASPHRSTRRDLTFFFSRRATQHQNQKPRLSRQGKLRHLSDIDIRGLDGGGGGGASPLALLTRSRYLDPRATSIAHFPCDRPHHPCCTSRSPFRNPGSWCLSSRLLPGRTATGSPPPIPLSFHETTEGKPPWVDAGKKKRKKNRGRRREEEKKNRRRKE